MKEYIEREAALAKITEQIDIARFPVDYNIGLSRSASAINNLPTADVSENVRGEWVEDDYGYIHCSHCGMEWDEPEHPKTNYCPNCGADMRKEATK